MSVAGVVRTSGNLTEHAADRRMPVSAKVPEIGVLFWLIKVLTTGMGEAASDYLGTLNPCSPASSGFRLRRRDVVAVPHSALRGGHLLVRRRDGGGVRDHGR